MIKNISEGENYKAVNIGSLSELKQHAFVHPKLGHTVESKVFVGEALNSTGAEVSFMELPAKTTVNFLHKHKQHEELYIFIKGEGNFQVDDEVFPIKEGSIVRVDPNGSRTLQNSSDEAMIYMVVQAVAGTINDHNIADGYRIKGEIKLK